MAIRNLFISRPVSTSPSLEGVDLPSSESDGGVFITPQTLTTFAGASSVIGVSTRVVTTLWPDVNGQTISAIIAIIVGVAIFGINVFDDQARPKTKSAWFSAVVVGLINTVYLVAVAIGVFETVGGPEGT